ncbi:hypothetical protein SBF1_50128 [Candidatus Desulfosporosinus infrequens]|uniref:LamG-like jellyroll fold domain-containing protein n=1 Tax=Candidatus Desulfosporosinus infrequens TaxID=2043169 RepID=A0A2U3LHB3_9FIRM|nr:hypothetical protein SBF1_50128 [Candidatus Desulfosporosinus infrequens]
MFFGLIGENQKPPIVTNGLVLWLDGHSFSNSPPTTTWVDNSGNNHNGIPANFGYTSTSGSDGGNGVAFDGVDDNIPIPSLVNTAMPQTFTFEIMLSTKRTSGAAFDTIGGYDYNNGFVLYMAQSGLVPTVRVFTNGVATNISGANLITGVKTHIVVTYDGNTLSIYSNGILISSALATGTFLTPTNNYCLGYAADRPANFWYGNIYMNRLYNRALSASEVLKNYNASK